jgi:hypothetical protein
MREQKIDIFDSRVLSKADAICFTSNHNVNSNGKLVMGAGVAKQFAQRYPKIPAFFGKCVKQGGNHVYVYEDNRPMIVSFPTKSDWRDRSIPDLVRQSARELMKVVNDYHFQLVALPFPGIGLGALNPDLIREIIAPILDDRIVIVSL